MTVPADPLPALRNRNELCAIGGCVLPHGMHRLTGKVDLAGLPVSWEAAICDGHYRDLAATGHWRMR